MWIGGARIIVLKEDKVLMVKHEHKERTFWIFPGGGVEEGETATEAAVREAKEETGLDIEIGPLVWHVEEVSEKRGMRFTNYYLATIKGGELGLGMDPEFSEEEQVLRDLKFFSKEELAAVEDIYPDAAREELWTFIDKQRKGYFYDAMRIRPSKNFKGI